jgi:hypothetical protein
VNRIKKSNFKKNQNKEYPSLYEVFKLGDRVKRTYLDNNGNLNEYSGIIMAIYNDSINIYWDTINGRYKPKEFVNISNNLTLSDIFNGSKNYSSIKKERYIFKNILKI